MSCLSHIPMPSVSVSTQQTLPCLWNVMCLNSILSAWKWKYPLPTYTLLSSLSNSKLSFKAHFRWTLQGCLPCLPFPQSQVSGPSSNFSSYSLFFFAILTWVSDYTDFRGTLCLISVTSIQISVLWQLGLDPSCSLLPRLNQDAFLLIQVQTLSVEWMK